MNDEHKVLQQTICSIHPRAACDLLPMLKNKWMDNLFYVMTVIVPLESILHTVSLIAVMLGKSQVVSRLNRQSWRDLPFSVYIVIYTTLYWQYIWQYIKVIFFKYVFEWKRISYYWEVFWWIPFGSASVSQGSCAMTQVFCSYISSSLAISSSCSLIWTFTSQSGRLLLHPAFLQRAP